MSFLFGSQKVPTVSSVTAPSITTSEDQKTIAEEEKKKIKQGQVNRPTLLTGPQGLLEPAPVSRKTLLGV